MKEHASGQETKSTIHKPLRIPKWILDLVENEDNKSKALIELMEIGAKVKHNGQEPVNVTVNV